MSQEPETLAKKCEILLESVLGLALRQLETLRFNKRDPQQLYAVCLYCRLIELAFACKAMLDANSLVGIPLLLRGMFEADIDLTNTLKCVDYPKRMYASFLEQKLRLTKELASPSPNPFLKDIRQAINPTDEMKKIQTELEELREENNGPINIRCRAEIAGRIDEYLSVYSMLCLDTHNNLRSLEHWHIEQASDNNYHAVAFKTSKCNLLHYLSSIPAILLIQSQALARFLEIQGIDFAPQSQELSDLQCELKTINAVTKPS